MLLELREQIMEICTTATCFLEVSRPYGIHPFLLPLIQLRNKSIRLCHSLTKHLFESLITRSCSRIRSVSHRRITTLCKSFYSLDDMLNLMNKSILSSKLINEWLLGSKYRTHLIHEDFLLLWSEANNLAAIKNLRNIRMPFCELLRCLQDYRIRCLVKLFRYPDDLLSLFRSHLTKCSCRKFSILHLDGLQLRISCKQSHILHKLGQLECLLLARLSFELKVFCFVSPLSSCSALPSGSGLDGFGILSVLLHFSSDLKVVHHGSGFSLSVHVHGSQLADEAVHHFTFQALLRLFYEVDRAFGFLLSVQIQLRICSIFIVYIFAKIHFLLRYLTIKERNDSICDLFDIVLGPLDVLFSMAEHTILTLEKNILLHL